MKFVIGLAAALAFGAVQTVATPALAQGGSTMETGSNASGGGKMSSGKMSGGKMQSKKMKGKKGKM